MKHNFANIQIAFNFFSNNCSNGLLKKVGLLGVGGKSKQKRTGVRGIILIRSFVLKEINRKRKVLP